MKAGRFNLALLGATFSALYFQGCGRDPKPGLYLPGPKSINFSGPDRSRLFDPDVVQKAVNALEQAKPDYSLAASHSWDLWKLVNQSVPRPSSFQSNGHLLEIPAWMTWCSTVELFDSNGSSAGRPECDLTGGRGPSVAPTDFLQTLGFRQKYKLEPANMPAAKTQVLAIQGNDFDTSYYSPDLVQALKQILSSAPCGSPQQPASIKNLKGCLEALPGAPAAANKFLDEKLPRNAIVVKAGWLNLKPVNNARIHQTILQPWDNAESWRPVNAIDSQRIALAGHSRKEWGSLGRYIILPSRGATCSAVGTNDTIPTVADQFALSNFLYFQYCGELLPGATNQLAGSYFPLVALHIMTNSQPRNQWTWSTFYWHPDAKAVNDPKLTPRMQSLQKERGDDKTGWRNNFRLDLQYTDRESVALEDVQKTAIANHRASLTTNCNVPATPAPANLSRGVFNPYIEGTSNCGGYSTCIACHSHARAGDNVPLRSTLSRTVRDPAETTSKIFTHFLWSLAEVQAP
jgi:hypothetical protein